MDAISFNSVRETEAHGIGVFLAGWQGAGISKVRTSEDRGPTAKTWS